MLSYIEKGQAYHPWGDAEHADRVTKFRIVAEDRSWKLGAFLSTDDVTDEIVEWLKEEARRRGRPLQRVDLRPGRDPVSTAESAWHEVE